MIRLTAACPPDLRAAMNALAVASTGDPTNAGTFTDPNWTDGTHHYAVASWPASEAWIGSALEAMQAAAIPHALWLGDGAAPLAAPDRVTIHAGDDGPAALAAMGLVPVPPEP